MEIAALVSSVVAVLVAAASAQYSRQQARGTKAQAIEAKRANDRLDAIDAVNAEAARVEAERNRVSWQLRDLGGNNWSLRNLGTQTACDVRLSARRAILLVDGSDHQGDQTLDEIRPQRPVSLTIVPTPSWGDAGPAQLAISWAGRDEPEVFDIPSA